MTGQNVLKGNHKITGKDLSIGIPALLVAFEQVLFAIFFHYSFRSREYHESEKPFAARMGTFRAAAHAFNPYDLLHGMFSAITLLLSGVGFRNNDSGRKGAQGPRRVGTYGRGFNQDNVHLEPLSGMGGVRPTGGYGYQGQEDPYMAPVQDYQRPSSTSQIYQPPPGPPGYEKVDHLESARLYPSHSRSHSREPSVDATITREMV